MKNKKNGKNRARLRIPKDERVKSWGNTKELETKNSKKEYMTYLCVCLCVCVCVCGHARVR